MVSQRTVAQDANHIAGYEGYPKPSKRTERLLIFSSARGAKRDHESETTLAVVVDLGYNGDPGEGLSVKRPRHSKLCRGHQEEAVRLTVAPLLESFDVSQIGRTVVTSTFLMKF